MRRFRFHIGTLLILIIVLSVSFAALRESNDTWDSGVFTLTIGVFLISTLLAIHRTEKRRAFWLGFTLFGAAYLTMSLVPPIESRLITTNLLAYIDSKVARSIPAGLGLAYFDYDNDNDGKMDLYVVNNSQANVLYRNKGNGTFQDVTTDVGLNSAGNHFGGNGWRSPTDSEIRWLRGSGGATVNFIHIGHSLLALIVAFLGGQLSRYLHSRNLGCTSGPPSPFMGHESEVHLSGSM
jgi:hypothetical protein